MTEVSFHFGAPEKMAYTCRLLRKAANAGAHVLVLADDDVTELLDRELWALGPLDFVPHCRDDAPKAVLRHSAVVLVTQHEAHPGRADQVLVNLKSTVPSGVGEFSRVIEVVSLDESDRAQARQRWKAYAGMGFTIKRHDLALKDPG